MSWMETSFEYGQEMRPWVSPSLIEANYILSLSSRSFSRSSSRRSPATLPWNLKNEPPAQPVACSRAPGAQPA